MQNQMFPTFFMGGFECSTHRDKRGRRLDLIASTRHDEFAELDYARLLETDIGTVRDGIRWHLIEKEPFRYDFSSLEQQARAAKKTGIRVIWDFFHYGFPDDLDIFAPEFVERFVHFSLAATEYLKCELGDDLFVCPVNEISFFSWIAGDVAGFYPAKRRRGDELKFQLVRATIKSMDTIRSVCPSVRFLLTDPAIHVLSKNNTVQGKKAAELYRQAQFHAFDMLAGRAEPGLGGGSKYLDIIGLNYYFHNQWRHPGRRTIPPGDKSYRPFNAILREYSQKYERPIVIAETGIEDEKRPEWLKYVCEQTNIAVSKGVTVEGICLYPVVNHPGWADNRHCHNGLWDYPNDIGEREVFQPLADEIQLQRQLLS